MRKDNEAYWTKKSETLNMRDASLKVDRRNETQKPYTEVGRHYKEFEMYNETQYGNRVSFPDVSKGKLNRVDFGNNKGLNRSVAESSLNDEIRSHQERSLKGARDEETDKIKKYLEKIDKI